MGINTYPIRTGRTWIEIASSTPSTGTAVSFTSIPEYTNLIIRWDGNIDGTQGTYNFRLNNDVGNSYGYLRTYNNTNSPYPTNLQGNPRATYIDVGSSVAAGTYTTGYFLIENANTTWKNISFQMNTTAWTSGPYVTTGTAQWTGTAAVNRIDITIPSTVATSTFRLLGSW